MKKQSHRRSMLVTGLTMVAIATSVFFVSVGTRLVEDGGDPRRALLDAGYQDISEPERAWFGCNDGDATWRATATNPRDRRVEVIVCCQHLGYGCAIRH